MSRGPKIVLSFPCPTCRERLVRFQEVAGSDGSDNPRSRPVQQHHLEKLTPACNYPRCPLRREPPRQQLPVVHRPDHVHIGP